MEFEELRKSCCAGVVLYNPEPEKLRENLDSLLPQVDALVLIDNASADREELRSFLAAYPAAVLIENEKNEGIARALNQIAAYAREQGYAWFLSMDQDSCCAPDLIATYAAHMPADERTAILCPYILNNRKMSVEEFRTLSLPDITEITNPVDCISSGSLNRTEAVLAVGGCRDELFIDCVDTELNMRLLLGGYRIFRVNRTYMLQTMGEPRPVRLMQTLFLLTGWHPFRALSYSPVYSDMRLYHIVRNNRFMRRTYGKRAGYRTSAAWISGEVLFFLLTYPRERSRLSMLKSAKKGLRDSKKLGNMDP